MVQRIPPPGWLAIALATAVLLHLSLPLAAIIPAPWHSAGIAVAALGVALGGSSVVLFRRARTTIIPFRESSALITSGPYRFTRNPIYLSMVLLLLGACVYLGSLSSFVVVPAFALLIDRRFIGPEEQMLVRSFPAEYAAYSARVRRWL